MTFLARVKRLVPAKNSCLSTSPPDNRRSQILPTGGCRHEMQNRRVVDPLGAFLAFCQGGGAVGKMGVTKFVDIDEKIEEGSIKITTLDKETMKLDLRRGFTLF